MNNKIQALKKVLNIDCIISISALVVLIAITFFGVIMRYFFNNPFSWLEEVQLLCFVWLSFFAGSAAFRYGSHVSIEIIVDSFPNKLKKIIEWAIYIIVICVLIYMMIQGINLIKQLFLSARKTNILGIPYYLIYSALPVGFALMIINASVYVIKNMWLIKENKSKGDA